MTAASIATPFIARPSMAEDIATPAASPIASPRPGEATPTALGPQLFVSPLSVRLDERFNVAVTGLRSGQQVTVSSRFTDYREQEWSASATWGADGSTLDLAAQPPKSGDFAFPDPMALIWGASGGIYYAYAQQGTESVEITATVDGKQIGRATVRRGLGLADGQPTYIYNDEMVANFYQPASGAVTPAPAVLLLGGSDGSLSPVVDYTAALLASHGYAAMNLAYFGPIGHLPRTLENIPLEYFGKALDWLKRQPSVRKDRIGVIGYSRGGELALLLGAYYPELTAVVSFSGSGYAVASPTAVDQPAWTWRGQPVPYLRVGDMNNDEALAGAEIPAERTKGPILMVSGDGDQLWPSAWLSAAAWRRLQRMRHPWPDQFLQYPGAGHAIVPPYQPMLPMVPAMLGGDPLSNEIASVNSWQAVLHLLAERLRY